MDQREQRRLELQDLLDAAKTAPERNKLGQFATPHALAAEIVSHAVRLHHSDAIRFLEPSIGTGAFYSALLQAAPDGQLVYALGFEVDPHYGEAARSLWSETPLDLRVESFIDAQPPVSMDEKFNLVIANPPYVRHHHLTGEMKALLQERSERCSGIRLGGLAGLYCHFVTLCHAWMAENALAAWLIPSEFMDVNYGAQLKRYLLERVTLLRIHRFDPNDVQFGDALVSSTVVWFRKSPPPAEHEVEFSFGGGHEAPAVTKLVPAATLRHEAKWTRFPLLNSRSRNDKPTLGDFFAVKRGIATGGNNFFVVSDDQVRERGLPSKFLRPILPSPRHLDVDVVEADGVGVPMIARRLFLIDCDVPLDHLRQSEPSLWEYLRSGEESVGSGYLCSKRTPWYSQEKRPPPPILCTYMGRGDNKDRRPFRFILNRSKATAANVYLLLYPTPVLQRCLDQQPALLTRIWAWLNDLSPSTLLGEGRVYGGGLYKLEPKELANVPAEWLAEAAGVQRQPLQQQLGF